MSKVPEKYGLADLMRKSTAGKLDHVASVVSSGQGALGYEAVSGWIIAHPGKACPVDYVILFAEAAASGVSTEHVEQTHWQAARMAQYLVSHMETSHPAIMAKMPFKFSTRHRARPSTPPPRSTAMHVDALRAMPKPCPGCGSVETMDAIQARGFLSCCPDRPGAMNRQFVENDAGVHLMMGEYTLCGDAGDAPESEPDWTEGAFQPTARQTISCPRCVEIVMACRGLRVKKHNR